MNDLLLVGGSHGRCSTNRRVFRQVSSIAAAIFLAGIAMGLVNPALPQPCDFYDAYRFVGSFEIISYDEDAQEAHLKLSEVYKGTWTAPGPEVIISVDGDAALIAAKDLAVTGRTVVAFIGKPRARQAGDFQCYMGGKGRWQAGHLGDATDLSRWIWDQDLGDTLFGTFNGASERLAEMMADTKSGKYFFPATPSAEFHGPQELGRVTGAAGGVALIDLNSDGRLDVIATSSSGNRAWLQTGAHIFTESSAVLGIAGTKSSSIGVADANGDGIPDLLLDGQLWLGSGAPPARTFTVTKAIPIVSSNDVIMATFAEMNGDGWPDVVISRRGHGLGVYLNPGAAGGNFRDATATLGLDTPACGSAQSGYVSAGDWDGDGRTDLWYSVAAGLLLVPNAKGQFAPLDHGLDLSSLAADGSAGGGGSAAFGAVWTASGQDLVVSTGSGVSLLARVRERLRDRTSSGNELTESSSELVPLIAADLDADGRTDIFAASQGEYPSKLYMNRGYGSFTCPMKYKGGVIPDEVVEYAVAGLAVGDADGDGANDILMAGHDGRILVLWNALLEQRPLTVDISATRQNRVLAATRIFSIQVSGLGTVGADVQLLDEKGIIVNRASVGGNTATGCRSSDTIPLTVRAPGNYSLHVRFADGVQKEWPLTAPVNERHLVMQAAHP